MLRLLEDMGINVTVEGEYNCRYIYLARRSETGFTRPKEFGDIDAFTLVSAEFQMRYVSSIHPSFFLPVRSARQPHSPPR